MRDSPKYILDCSQSGSLQGQGLWPVYWQQQLIAQMADAAEAEGLSSKQVGKNKIARLASHWKREKMKVLFAVDNLPEDAKLGDLLPYGFSRYLPAGSCVIVSVQGNHENSRTSADVYQDIKDVIRDSTECHCGYKRHLVRRLRMEEMRLLFKGFAKESPKDNDGRIQEEAADNVIQRCEGLPLLVIWFGKYFRNPRPLREWHELCDELERVHSKYKSTHRWDEVFQGMDNRTRVAATQEEEFHNSFVVEKLGVLYRKKLSEELQTVVGDIANVFNGWSQGTVSTILGQELMEKLKSALELKKVNAIKNLPRIAEVTRDYGYGARPWKMPLLFVPPEMLGSARQIYREQHLQAVASPMPELLFSVAADGVKRTCRSLCLVDCKEDFEMRWFGKLQNLRYVVLHNITIAGSNMIPLDDLRYLHLGTDYPAAELRSFPFRSKDLMNLKTLVLQGFSFEGCTFQMPPQLANLFLTACKNLDCAFQLIIGSKTLENIHIQACKRVYQLPARQSNRSIKALSLQVCKDLDLQHLPQVLVKLEALEKLEILACNRRSEIAEGLAEATHDPAAHYENNPANSQALKDLIISNCHDLVSLPAEVFSYTNISQLDLELCSRIETLPPDIQVFCNVKNLNLACCISLETLPPEIGSLTTLERLSLSECSKLKSLPREIGTLQMLAKLKLDHCADLNSLPGEFLHLKALNYLSLSGCFGLRNENIQFNLSKLPQRLKYLNISGLDANLLNRWDRDLSSADRRPLKLVKDESNRYRGFNFQSQQPEGTEKSTREVERQFKSDRGPSTQISR